MNLTLSSLMRKLNQNPGKSKSFKVLLEQEIGLMKIVFERENMVT